MMKKIRWKPLKIIREDKILRQKLKAFFVSGNDINLPGRLCVKARLVLELIFLCATAFPALSIKSDGGLPAPRL
jgi:hypothetical protein